MRITQLDATAEHRRWRMRLHGLAEDAVQFRSRERARRRLVGELHVFHQLTEPGPVFGGDEVQRRVIEERQLQLDLVTHALARTGERRGGTEGGRTGRARWSPYN